jgi:hypothetical protein
MINLNGAVRRGLVVASGVMLASSLAFASPAAAGEDHASCGAGARSYVVALAHSGFAGETASELAKSGALSDNVHTAHALLCEPKD